MRDSWTFPHRFNSDGTIDSICPGCLITVATTDYEADLAASERLHVCTRRDLLASLADTSAIDAGGSQDLRQKLLRRWRPTN